MILHNIKMLTPEILQTPIFTIYGIFRLICLNLLSDCGNLLHKYKWINIMLQ